jgi:hypothetical protein
MRAFFFLASFGDGIVLAPSAMVNVWRHLLPISEQAMRESLYLRTTSFASYSMDG